ncbi:MAG TPA: hypothetical protein VGO62_09535 [Myxococcota bacterium]|jgi:hypothetical protein
MATSADFVDACNAATDALDHVNTLATALYYAATNEADQGLAQAAQHYATVAGPAGIAKAVATGDAHYLANVQHGLGGVTEDVQDELRDDVINRFLLLAINPLLALAPADVLDEASDDLSVLADSLPDPPQAQPWYLWAGGGAGVGAAVGLTVGGLRGALGGAVGGVALGLLGQYALGKLADKFTL